MGKPTGAAGLRLRERCKRLLSSLLTNEAGGLSWRKSSLILLSAVLLAAIVWSIPRFGERVFYLDDAKYRLAGQSGDTAVYRTRGNGEPVTVLQHGDTVDIRIGQEAMQVRLLEKSAERILYEVIDSVGSRKAELQWNGMVLIQGAGGEFFPEIYGYSGGSNGKKYIFDTDGHPYPAATLLRIADPSLQPKDGKAYYYLFGGLLLAAGTIHYRFRDFFFRLQYGLWVEDPEPTDMYLFVNKGVSVAVAVVGICFLIGGVQSVF